MSRPYGLKCLATISTYEGSSIYFFYFVEMIVHFVSKINLQVMKLLLFNLTAIKINNFMYNY